MIRLTLSRLLHDRARSLFLVATLLLSVLSFLVLGASAKTSQVKTTGTVLGAPAAYDLIVRPPSSVTAQERTTRLVRANYLSGVFGGITLKQWRTIQKSAGVQTAAPIAMIGQVFERAFVPVDLTAYVDKKTTTVLRFTSTDHSRGATTSTPGPNGYLMVGPKVTMKQDSNIVQQIGDRQVKWCPELDYGDYSQHGPLAPDNQLAMTCTDVTAGETHLPTDTINPWPHGTGHYVAYVPVTLPVTIAAIDPASEQAMVGLDDAITTGKNLTGQKVTDDELHDQSDIPVLSASHLDVADDLTVDVSRLEAPSVTKLQTGDLTPRQSVDLVRTAPAQHVTTTTITAAQAHTTWLNETNFDRQVGHMPMAIVRPAGVTYTGKTTTGLRATGASVPQDAWRNQTFSSVAWVNLPPAIASSTYRTATVMDSIPSDETGAHMVQLNVVGQFDPTKVKSKDGMSRLPMPPYETPTATAADTATRALIPGGTLKPDNNPLGYLQQAPTLLTSLDVLPELVSARAFQLSANANIDAPISAIRVKVTGGQDGTKEAAARVKLVAQRIHEDTGLDVQVIKGASPKPVTVTLPATVKGEKDLTIIEPWTKLDVATTIVAALDRKTLVLLVLVLASSALAVAISAHAAVRARRVELGVLACIGWRRSTLIRSVLAEFFLIGLLAGVIGSLTAMLVAHLSDITLPTWWLLSAVPATVVMTLAAAALPAIRAGRSTPIAVVRDAPAAARRPIRVTGVASMAFSSVQRTPGRVLAAAASLAMGVASLALIYGITQAFRGAVVGTVMGDVVAVQVKTTDLLAALVLALVGLVSLGNVLFLDVREQAAHYASLRATGWSDRSLASLVTWQAAVIGVVGALAGAAIALTGLAAMSALTTTTALTTLLIAILGIGAAALVSLIPASSLSRLPTARLLAGE